MAVWEWAYNEETKSSYKKEIFSKELPDLSSFNDEIWNKFTEFARKYSYSIIWGPYGLESRNPEKPEQIFYDGIVFFYIQKEFKDCIEDESVERFLSCLTHFNYENINFVVMDS